MIATWRKGKLTSESLRRTISGAVITTLFVSTLLLSSEVEAADWSSPAEISSGAWWSGSAYTVPHVSVDGSNVHVVWMDGRRTLDQDYDLYYASSPDGGTTWLTDRRIDTVGFYGSKPKLVSNGTELHIVLEDEGTFWHVFSTDGGATWQNDTVLSRTQSIEDYDLASEGSNLYLVWSEWELSPQSYDFYLVRSTDFGATWSAPIFIADMWGNHAYMGLDASEGWLHMVSDGGYIRSSDAGLTWDSLNGSLGGRDVSAEGPYVHLMRGNAYQLDGYMRSEDYGNTWTPMNSSIIGRISSIEEHVHIVNGSYYFLSNDRGVTFGDVGVIPDMYSVSPYAASVAVDTAARAHVVYLGYDIVQQDLEVFFVRSDSPDAPPSPPGPPQNLTAEPGNQEVRLSWDPPLTGGYLWTNYSIYRGTTPDNEVLVGVRSSLVYYDTGLTNGQMYFYRVSASDAVGEGPKSDQVNATPYNRIPMCGISSPPSGSEAAGTINVSGTADDLDGFIERVEVRLDNASWMVADGTTSWSILLDISATPNGNNTLYARSFDGQNYSESAEIQIIVNSPVTEASLLGQLWLWVAVLMILIVVLCLLFALLWKRRKS